MSDSVVRIAGTITRGTITYKFHCEWPDDGTSKMDRFEVPIPPCFKTYRLDAPPPGTIVMVDMDAIHKPRPWWRLWK